MSGLQAWIAICALGVFHGLNPGMGWLFALSNGLQLQSARGVFLALPPLAAGHLLAIGVVLFPVSLLSLYVRHLQGLKVVAGLLLIGFGVYKLVRSRHPRFLARIGPRHLVLWSFLMATSHGAALMVIPFFLDVHAVSPGVSGHGGHLAQAAPGGVVTAGLVTVVHTAFMVVTAGVMAWVFYRYLGLRMLQKSWFNLDLVWALFLVIVGVIALLS